MWYLNMFQFKSFISSSHNDITLLTTRQVFTQLWKFHNSMLGSTRRTISVYWRPLLERNFKTLSPARLYLGGGSWKPKDGVSSDQAFWNVPTQAPTWRTVESCFNTENARGRTFVCAKRVTRSLTWPLPSKHLLREVGLAMFWSAQTKKHEKTLASLAQQQQKPLVNLSTMITSESNV